MVKQKHTLPAAHFIIDKKSQLKKLDLTRNRGRQTLLERINLITSSYADNTKVLYICKTAKNFDTPLLIALWVVHANAFGKYSMPMFLQFNSLYVCFLHC